MEGLVEGLVETAVVTSIASAQVSAILLEVLDIALYKAVGQCGSESLSSSSQFQDSSTLFQLGRSSTEQKPGSSCPIGSCPTQTGLLDPNVCSQDAPSFKPTEVPRREQLQAGEEEEEELEELSPPSYLLNSPNTSELGSLADSPEMEQGESLSLPNPNQDAIFLSSKSIEGEMVNWQTEEEDELTPPSLQNSPTTSELNRLQRWGSTPSSMESSPREGSQHTTTETDTDSKSKIRLHNTALQLLSTSQLKEEIHRADRGNSTRLVENLPGSEGELMSKSKRQRTSNLGTGSPAEILRGKSVELEKKNDQVSSANRNAGRNVEISDNASSDGSYSLGDNVEKKPISPDSYEEIFDSSSATEVEAPKLSVKDQPKLLHRAPRLGLSRQQNLSSIHQAAKRAFFSPEADNQSFVLEE